MPEGTAVMNDRQVKWKPGDIKWPETGKELSEENEFVAAGHGFSETPPERWSDTEYDNWAVVEQTGTVTKVDNGMVFIQLDTAFRGRWWTVAYPEGLVASDPALDDVSEVWEEFISTLEPTSPVSVPTASVDREGNVELHEAEPDGTPSLNGTA
jgi:hypothetical protein